MADLKFDLGEVDTKTRSEEGVAMTIRKIDGAELTRDGKPVRIFLRGPDSEVYIAGQLAQVRKRFARAADRGSLKPADIDLSEADRDALDLMVACTVSWEQVKTPEGKDIPCTRENVQRLYENYPMIREQVDAFITNRAHFIAAPSKP